MKIIAVLAMSVIGVIILPAASFLQSRNGEWVGGRTLQDAQPKKASFDNPVLELEIKREVGVTAIACSPDSLVTAVAFSPDGQRLASGTEGLYSLSSHRYENGSVKIWRIK